MIINEQIENRKLFTGFDDSTYYTQDLFNFVVDNITDPDVLFKLKIYGYYKRRYKWTTEQCDYFIDNNITEAQGHDVSGTWFAYDWGSGENSVTNNRMHKPHLDHIIPREQGGEDVPENMRIRVARLNESKGNTNSDIERFAIVLDMLNDIEDKELYRDKLKRYAENF